MNRRNNRVDLISGKLPPQALDLEAVVLGAIMLEKDAFEVAHEVLKHECFYKDANQIIFHAFENLYDRRLPIDILSVSEELKRMGRLEDVGGIGYVVGLTNDVISSAHIELHSKIIYEKYHRRQIIKLSMESMAHAYDESEDVFDVHDELEKNLANLGTFSLGSMTPIKKVVYDTFQQISEWKEDGNVVTGVPTGFKKLDFATRGWQRGDLIILAARPSVGKCLGRGTKVVMYDGRLKNVEDVVVGDLLMGDDSSPRTVLSLSRGKGKMYKIKQVRGIEYRVNENHVLSIMRSRNSYSKKHGEKADMPIREYLSQSNKFRNNWKGYKTGVEFSEKETEMPPYMLGVWLGDGTADKAEVTNPDSSIIEYIQEYARDNDMKGVVRLNFNSGHCPQISICGKDMRSGSPRFLTILRDMNLLGNKHIPDNFLYNSRQNRLKLLAGLLDTDGYLSQGGTFEITQKSYTLIKQIKFLADSLGFRTSLNEKKATIKSIGFEGIYYRLTITGDLHNIPNKIERKKWKRETRSRDHKISGLSITEDGVDDYFGFTLDGNHRFLLEDFTVTHNSSISLHFAEHAAESNKGAVCIFSLEMSAKDMVLRMIAADSEKELFDIQTGRLTDDELSDIFTKTGDYLASKNIFFEDSFDINVFSMRRKLKKIKKENGLSLVIIDYLQLMRDKSNNGKGDKNREREVAEFSRALKSLAKELDVPVMALSQLNRESGAKNITWNNGPTLAALRESGAIEQDADLVLMLWEPAQEECPPVANEHDPNDRKLGIKKQRNGRLVDIELRFEKNIQKMKSLENVNSIGTFKPF